MIDPLNIALFILCVLLSAFFSSSEVALISITKVKVRTLANEGRAGAQALLRLKESPSKALTTILIGNTVVNIAAAAIATATAIQAFGDIGVGIATGAVVIILLVFGEIGPKVFATRASEEYALAVAGPVLWLSYVFAPAVWAVDRMSRSLRFRADETEASVTEAEIKEWIDVGTEEGTIEEDEQDMLYSVLEFGDTTAREVMTPRVEVVVIEDTTTMDEAVRVFSDTGFSRIPVFRERIDNIIGILNVKDVLSALQAKQKEVMIKDLMYDPYFVPETKKIDELLRELQVRKIHIAIVIDEYGVFIGIITVEDILEELVGEIQDEFDTEEPEIQTLADGVYVVDAQMWVEKVNDELGVNLPVEPAYETIGGLIIDRLGHIPLHPGEKVEVDDGRLTLVVMQMHGRRIVKVKIIVHSRQDEGKQ